MYSASISYITHHARTDKHSPLKQGHLRPLCHKIYSVNLEKILTLK